MHSFQNSINDHYREETYFCNYSNKLIQNLAHNIAKNVDDPLKFTETAFTFVRDKIIFGGDLWQIRASETLKKGYGACWNKNLLLIAFLRYHKIPARLKANPMRKDFMKPAIGAAYLTKSNPFYHCFTEVYLQERWIAIDPTLDQKTYNTFFAPLKIDWTIGWRNGADDMRLYTESIIGPAISCPDIDRALQTNLKSHFLFNHEPDFLLKAWLNLGNKIMWQKTGNNI